MVLVTRSREDYLRAMYVLEENDGVKSVKLANYLNVSKPSVSEMMRNMGSEGLVTYRRYGSVKFTGKGRRMGVKLTAKHRLIELFLRDVLKLKSKELHDEAHRLEHAFSDESIRSMKKLLHNPKFDPHGKPIPHTIM